LNTTIRSVWACALFAACATSGVQAEPLRFQCNTVMRYDPGPCHKVIDPVEDNSILVVDLDRGTWTLDSLSGAAAVSGSTITLKQWGSLPGRDATLDRASGAFSYQLESGCLIQHQTGFCKALQ
jgi:hypothetical protein